MFGRLALIVVAALVLWLSWSEHQRDARVELVDPAYAVRGKRVANRCVACHALERRDNKIGPHLVGIVGRDVAGVRGYDYSEPMRAFGGTWSRERLKAFLRAPQAVVPGSRMAVSPMNEVELEGLLVYLESLQ